jgi:NitT/TauT family transport system substrate-binding protein
MTQTRRRFLAGLSGVGAAGVLRNPALAAEGPPETTSVRLLQQERQCIAPEYVVADLLRAEGFTDVRYVSLPPGANTPDGIAQSAIDFGVHFGSVQIVGIDRGVAMKVLAGVHVGCFELFVNKATRGVADLEGKKVGIQAVGSPEHLFLSVIAGNVGIDPKTQIDWVTTGPVRPRQLFIDGKVDAFLGFPRSRRSCAPAVSAASSSIARSIARGRNIFAACSPGAPTTSRPIRSRRSGWCGRS